MANLLGNVSIGKARIFVNAMANALTALGYTADDIAKRSAELSHQQSISLTEITEEISVPKGYEYNEVKIPTRRQYQLEISTLGLPLIARAIMEGRKKVTVTSFPTFTAVQGTVSGSAGLRKITLATGCYNFGTTTTAQNFAIKAFYVNSDGSLGDPLKHVVGTSMPSNAGEFTVYDVGIGGGSTEEVYFNDADEGETIQFYYWKDDSTVTTIYRDDFTGCIPTMDFFAVVKQIDTNGDCIGKERVIHLTKCQLAGANNREYANGQFGEASLVYTCNGEYQDHREA